MTIQQHDGRTTPLVDTDGTGGHKAVVTVTGGGGTQTAANSTSVTPASDAAFRQLSLTSSAGGTSQLVAISTTSAQSAAITTTNGWAVVSPTVDTFVRQGANPTALSDGTDLHLFGGMPYRIAVTTGNKLAFKTASGSGSVYITPDA